jgi:hypothetical protein
MGKMNEVIGIVNRARSFIQGVEKQKVVELEEAQSQQKALHDKLIAPIKEAVCEFNQASTGKKYVLQFAGNDKDRFFYIIDIVPHSERIVITQSSWMPEVCISLIPECVNKRNDDPWFRYSYVIPHPEHNKDYWTIYQRMHISLPVGYEFLDPEDAAEMLTSMLAAYAGGFDKFCCFSSLHDCMDCKRKCVREFLGIPSLTEHNLAQNLERQRRIYQKCKVTD